MEKALISSLGATADKKIISSKYKNLEEKDLTLIHITSRRKHDDTGDRIDFFFKAKEWEGKVENLEPEKCDNLLWANPDELPPNVGPHIRHVLGEIKKGNFYSEFDSSKSNA